MIKKLVDCIDDPVEINNLFNTILNSNKNMTNYCKKVHDKLLLQKEIINLHETQDNQEITNLICKSVIDDIIHNIEIDYVKIPNNHYEKLLDDIQLHPDYEDTIESTIETAQKENEKLKEELEYIEKKYTKLNNKYNDKISPLMTDKHRLTSENEKLKIEVSKLNTKYSNLLIKLARS